MPQSHHIETIARTLDGEDQAFESTDPATRILLVPRKTRTDVAYIWL